MRKVFLLAILLMVFYDISNAQNADSTAVMSKRELRREARKNKKAAKHIVPAPDLSDTPFVDYSPAIIYMTPSDSISDAAYLRNNFTDQFISVWEKPSRIYPASIIHGFSQDGKYYRSCSFDKHNHVFGEQIVKGRINLYYARRLPQTAGLIEFISADPKKSDYRNYMIVQYEDSPRYSNDFYYFITLENDSLETIPVNDFKQFADDYLKSVPEAHQLLMNHVTKKNFMNKVLPPTIAILTFAIVVSSDNLSRGLLVSSPVIAGGVIHYLIRRKRGKLPPTPDEMAGIIMLYNKSL